MSLFVKIRGVTSLAALIKKKSPKGTLHQWAEVDSNHRSKLQQIYSLPPLATRESTHNLYKHHKGGYMQADERTRTVNLLITNQLLCQLSHIGTS